MDNIKKDLFELFELDKVEPEKAIEMINRLAKLVFQAVLVRVLPLLSEEDLTEYEKIVEGQQGADVLFKFFTEKISDFDSIVREESENLRIEMSKDMTQVGLN
jgi:hypothetical protein